MLYIENRQCYGNRLIATDPNGTTAHLGAFELKKVGTTVSGTRFYGNASRSSTGGLSWIAADPHGTGQLAIDATTLTATRPKTDPFGNPRGTAVAKLINPVAGGVAQRDLGRALW